MSEQVIKVYLNKKAVIKTRRAHEKPNMEENTTSF